MMMITADEPRLADTNELFFRSTFENNSDLVTAFDDDGVFGYVSPSIERLLGWRSDEVVGRSFSDFMHPDDLERAILHVATADDLSCAPGNAVFRLRHADGSWVPLDISAGRASDGTSNWFVCFCRLAVSQQAETEIVARLLNADSLRDVLAPVMNSFSWQDLGSQVAICWTEDGRRQHVTTGLPDVLCGLDDSEPWLAVRWSGRSVLRDELSGLPHPHRQAAAAAHRGGYWVEPVRDGDDPALIVLWTAPGVDPRLHEYGMRKARRYLELVLQFTAQRRALDHAASHDPLTGLANRAALLDAMSSNEGGALVYCDLDRFKPVNDALGHGAGDELLSSVAERLRSSVRSDDLVARIGGDEFVVLCRDIDAHDTELLASRVLDALHQPFTVGQHVVDIGASIGVAFERRRVDQATLVAADHALYAAKAAGRGVVRWADGPGAPAA